MKVLVIDDDSDVAEVVSLAFELKNPDAVTLSAVDGTTGVEAVKAETPDAVILDIGLPDIDGFQVLKEIRSFSDVSVVMLSVRDTEEAIKLAYDLGADDYITKPFRPPELLARVEEVVRRRRGTPGED